jgi:hypothetical protein
VNRILVICDPSISAQARTYAEYRLFATLARHVPGFHRARVVLRGPDSPDGRDDARCSMSVALESRAAVHVRTAEPHVYAAINRAVDRLCGALESGRERRGHFISACP